MLLLFTELPSSSFSTLNSPGINLAQEQAVTLQNARAAHTVSSSRTESLSEYSSMLHPPMPPSTLLTQNFGGETIPDLFPAPTQVHIENQSIE